MEDQQHLAMRQQPFSQKQRYACEQPHISVLPSPGTQQVSFSHTWWFTFVTTCTLTALWNDIHAHQPPFSTDHLYKPRKNSVRPLWSWRVCFLLHSLDYRAMYLYTTSLWWVWSQFGLTVLLLAGVISSILQVRVKEMLTTCVQGKGRWALFSLISQICSVYSLESHTKVSQIWSYFCDLNSV